MPVQGYFRAVGMSGM